MDVVYWIIWFIVHALIITYCCSDWHYGKTMYRKVRNIANALDLTEDIKVIEVHRRGKTFSIKAERGEGPEGISYITPRYSYRNVYINNELVCVVHSISSNLLTRRCIAEFSSKRDEAEITVLINLASKEATRIQKNYYNKTKNHKSNSFFN